MTIDQKKKKQRQTMADPQHLPYSFSYETHLSNTHPHNEIHLIIKRSRTHQTDIVIKIPYATNGVGPPL